MDEKYNTGHRKGQHLSSEERHLIGDGQNTEYRRFTTNSS